MVKKAEGQIATVSREKIAILITAVSIVGITFLSLMVIIFAWIQEDKKLSLQTIQLVFSSILPLFGTWVGTVMAFYFSRENFGSATESITKSINTIGSNMSQKPAVKNVVDIMIQKHRIKPYKIENLSLKDDNNETRENAFKEIKLDDFVKKMDRDEKYRIVVIDKDDVPIAVLHRSLLSEFLNKKRSESDDNTQITNLSLNDYFIEKMGGTPDNSFVVISEITDLNSARAEMIRKKNCKDIIVTKYGTNTEGIIGWITNNYLIENL